MPILVALYAFVNIKVFFNLIMVIKLGIGIGGNDGDDDKERNDLKQVSRYTSRYFKLWMTTYWIFASQTL